jgi:hypothetical protein
VDVTITGAGHLDAALSRIARVHRIVCISGLPGVGKSLCVRELARTAAAAGRSVHLLQWDVVRLAFATPSIEARYPEREGITHAMIRVAVGKWARGAVLRWHQDHPSTGLLIGEVPIIGHRLLDLVQVQDDDVEPLLAGEETLFVTPVPSAGVRADIANARGRTTAAPVHARETGDAPPGIVESSWHEIYALAADPPLGPDAYDPQVYAAVYRQLLRHRHAITLWMNAPLEPRTSVYDLGVTAHELTPAPDEVSATVAQLQRDYTEHDIEQIAARWFDAI